MPLDRKKFKMRYNDYQSFGCSSLLVLLQSECDRFVIFLGQPLDNTGLIVPSLAPCLYCSNGGRGIWRRRVYCEYLEIGSQDYNCVMDANKLHHNLSILLKL